jgi:hypothetical protein
MAQLFSNNARAFLVAAVTSSSTSLTIDAVMADAFPVANVGTGAVPSLNNWFKAVLQDSLGNIEIVYVRTRVSGSGVLGNVIRGQEGTTARDFSAGAVVGLRLTAADINSIVDIVSKNNAFTGTNSFAGSTAFYGSTLFATATSFSEAVSFGGGVSFSSTSTFLGSATFNLPINGSLAGNAATVTNGVYTIGTQTISGDKVFSGLLSLSSPRIVIANSSLAMYEMHIPGNSARAWYLNTDGVTRLAITNGGGGASTVLLSVDGSGNTTAAGDITAYSDERLKENWRDLPDDFVERLARVKMGAFDRKDTGKTQVGVGAASLRDEALPHAVHTDSDGNLSVAYGNAALASCVALARELVALKQKLGV